MLKLSRTALCFFSPLFWWRGSLFSNAKDGGWIIGFQAGRVILRVIYLHFALNTIIFCSSSVEEVKTINGILRCFELAFDSKLNLHKSIMVGVGINDDMVQFLSWATSRSQNLALSLYGIGLLLTFKRVYLHGRDTISLLSLSLSWRLLRHSCPLHQFFTCLWVRY